jgi:hypothetical protein
MYTAAGAAMDGAFFGNGWQDPMIDPAQPD